MPCAGFKQAYYVGVPAKQMDHREKPEIAALTVR
jgi:hypothetical protein